MQKEDTEGLVDPHARADQAVAPRASVAPQVQISRVMEEVRQIEKRFSEVRGVLQAFWDL